MIFVEADDRLSESPNWGIKSSCFGVRGARLGLPTPGSAEVCSHSIDMFDLRCLKWVMDALVCNLLGILLGMKTLRYLQMKPYHWRSMWNIPSYR